MKAITSSEQKNSSIDYVQSFLVSDTIENIIQNIIDDFIDVIAEKDVM